MNRLSNKNAAANDADVGKYAEVADVADGLNDANRASDASDASDASSASDANNAISADGLGCAKCGDSASRPEFSSSRRSIVYWLRVGVLTFSLSALPVCAIFLPNLKTFVAKISVFSSACVAVAADAELSPLVDSQENFSNDASTDRRENSSIRRDEIQRLRTLAAPPTVEFGRGEANSVAQVAATEPASESARRLVGAELTTAREIANLKENANLRKNASLEENTSSRRFTELPQKTSTSEIAALLERELSAHGVEAARVERWGDRFWRASGRTPTDERAGVAFFGETVDSDPTVAARSLLAQFSAQRAAR